LITAIYESASFGKTVKLPLKEDSPFYTREGLLKYSVQFYEKSTSIENFSHNEITT